MFTYAVETSWLLDIKQPRSGVRTAVRDTGVSRHHKGPIEAYLKRLGQSQHYRFQGLKGALNYAPIMTRDNFFCIVEKNHTKLDCSFSQIVVSPVSISSPAAWISLQVSWHSHPTERWSPLASPHSLRSGIGVKPIFKYNQIEWKNFTNIEIKQKRWPLIMK